jgi:hypothetical protein
MGFELSEEQKHHLTGWRTSLERSESRDWYLSVKQASADFNKIISEAGFRENRDLVASQIDELFRLMKRLSRNRGLGRNLYEQNGLSDFNKRLRILLFSSEPIAKRVNQFRELKGVKEVVMSHFLCMTDPAAFPYITPETFDMLRINSVQDNAAKLQALSEHSIHDPGEYHGTSIKYLKDWVVFKAVKDYLSLETFPLVNRILWDAYTTSDDEEHSENRPARGEELLYEPIAKTLKSIEGSGKEAYWVKITARSDRKGQWSRPDIISVDVQRFDYLPGKSLLVTSYEVKRKDHYNLSSVYEAAAHQRWAHNTFLVLEVENGEEPIDSDVELEAARLGVGIKKAYLKSPNGEMVLAEVSEAKRNNPVPQAVNEIVEDFFEGDINGLLKYKHAIG